jgi:DNA-binding transcriptional LysR family regulator
MRSPRPAAESADTDWNDLKVLLALSRGGSVAAAARALAVDQSTVSRRLAALEEALGCTLLVRGGREFFWTDEGRTMIGAAEAAEAAVGAAARRLRSSRLDASGTVRVATTPGIAAVLLRLLPQFRHKAPGLEFDLSGSAQHVDLAKGEADIAVRAGAPTEPELIVRKAMRSGWFLYASEAYLRDSGGLQSLDDLPRHRLVLMAAAVHALAPGLRWLEDRRDPTTPITRVDNLQAAIQMAALGRGLVVLPHLLAHAERDIVRAWPEPVTQSDLYLMYHESMRGVARIRAAIELLSELIAAHRDEWSGLPPQV